MARVFSVAAFALVVLLLLAAPLRSTADATVDATAVSFRDPFDGLLGVQCTSRSECGLLPGLACLNGVCDYCRVDTDCSTSGKIRRCHYKEQGPVDAVSASGERVAATLCVEKDLFAPFLTTDVLATVLAFLSTALGSGCGIGGGGLLVPAFILVTGLSPKHAIPLSKATIFGNAIAIFIFNVNRKHPLKPHMPIINYDLAAIMEPTTLIGTVIGVMLNHILPNWLILLKLVTLLAFITYHTFLKGGAIHEKETRAREALLKKALTGGKNGGGRGRTWSIYRHFDWKIAAHRWLQQTRRNRKLRAQQREDEADFQSLPPLLTGKSGPQATPLLDRPSTRQLRDVTAAPSFGTFAGGGNQSDDSTRWEISQSIKRREADAHPVRVIFPLMVCWLVVLLQSLLRGGHGSPSLIGVACATAGYWALTAFPLLVLVVIAWRVGYRLRLENRLRVVSGYQFLESDTHWTWDKVTKFPIICTTAGVAAGLLGIGGGMVQSPIMLEMGVLPAVQSATAGYMVLYTASSTTLQFAIGGQFPGTLQYDYAAWFAFIGFLGGLAGQKGVAYIVKKYKRESIMVYILAVTIGLSALAMGLVGLSSTIHDLHNGQNMGFSSLCGNA